MYIFRLFGKTSIFAGFLFFFERCKRHTTIHNYIIFLRPVLEVERERELAQIIEYCTGDSGIGFKIKKKKKNDVQNKTPVHSRNCYQYQISVQAAVKLQGSSLSGSGVTERG